MSQNANQHPTGSASGKPQGFPEAGARPGNAAVPVWLFFLLFVLLFWGMYYFDQRSGWFNPNVYTPYRSFADLRNYQPISGSGNLERGRVVYETTCALCHDNDGSGKPNQAPPLAGTEWVLGSHQRLIAIPLAGLQGPITVRGEEWNLAMPAMGAALSDEDLAAVLSYIRQAWGNDAPEITVEQVQEMREELRGRTQPFTAAELAKYE
jgi:mono/diheme cytochrome c family protein